MEGPTKRVRLEGARLRAGVVLLLALSVLAACNLLEGLEENSDALLSRPTTYFDAPGKQIAAGGYQDILIQGSDEGTPFIAARTTASPPRLEIIKYHTGEPCDAGPAAAYQLLDSWRADTPIVTVVGPTKSDGSRDVRFVDDDCQEMHSPYLNSPRDPLFFPEGIFVSTEAGQLDFIDVTTGETRIIARDAVDYDIGWDYGWLLTGGGELYVAGYESWELVENNVVEFEAQHAEYAAVLDFGTDNAPTDMGDRVLVLSRVNGSKNQVAGCAPTLASGFWPVVAELPCASGVYYLLAWGLRRLHAFRLPDGFEQPLWVNTRTTTDGFAVVLTRGEVDSGAERLYHAFVEVDFEASAQTLDDDLVAPPLELTEYESDVLRGGWGRGVLVDVVGGSGTYATMTLGSSAEAPVVFDRAYADVAAWTTSFTGGGLLLYGHWGGTVGSLRLEKDDGTSVGIAENLGPLPTPLSSPSELYSILYHRSDGAALFALVTDVQGGAGSLRVVTRAHEPASRGELLPAGDVLATGAAPWSARPLAKIDAFGYLSADGRRTLRVVFRDSGIKLQLLDDVSEWHSVDWPVDGIVYVVDRGDNQGIWFAKGR